MLTKSILSSIRGAFLKKNYSTTLSISAYHKLADEALDYLCTEFEKACEEHSGSIPGCDVEHSMGVLKLAAPIPQYGTLVLNKQPPNKQIWLSSPLS